METLQLSAGQWSSLYNLFSFGLISMAATTVYTLVAQNRVLAKDVAKSLMTRLVIASSAMIILGYPGEVSSSTGTKMLWFVLSMIPFIYILYVLFVELTKSLDRQPEGVAGKIGNLRTLLVVTWMVYPISYLIPVFVADPSTSQAASLFTYRQVGYTLADVLAKCLFGLVVFNIARTKSAAEGMNESH